jgi:hypothetical protein
VGNCLSISKNGEIYRVGEIMNLDKLEMGIFEKQPTPIIIFKI